jgi:hypothetical protein
LETPATNQESSVERKESQTQTVVYEPPAIVDYGDLLELTAASGHGDCLDATFPVGTKKGSLTFSGC